MNEEAPFKEEEEETVPLVTAFRYCVFAKRVSVIWRCSNETSSSKRSKSCSREWRFPCSLMMLFLLYIGPLPSSSSTRPSWVPAASLPPAGSGWLPTWLSCRASLYKEFILGQNVTFFLRGGVGAEKRVYNRGETEHWWCLLSVLFTPFPTGPSNVAIFSVLLELLLY